MTKIGTTPWLHRRLEDQGPQALEAAPQDVLERWRTLSIRSRGVRLKNTIAAPTISEITRRRRTRCGRAAGIDGRVRRTMRASLLFRAG